VDLAGMHHVALSVTDLSRGSAAWYHDVLGLAEVVRVPHNLGLNDLAFPVMSADEMETWAGLPGPR